MEQIKHNDENEHEGEHYLRLLGLENAADQEIEFDGKTMQARDFLEICGEHARPMLVGFESMDKNDPRYETFKTALRSRISQYIGLKGEL